MKISRTIACCLLLSVSVLVFGCDGGGDGGSSSDLQAGTWTGEGVSFTINESGTLISNFSLTYSIKVTNGNCSEWADFPVAPGGGSHPIQSGVATIRGWGENGADIYVITITFTGRTTATLVLTWTHEAEVCGGTFSGTETNSIVAQ